MKFQIKTSASIVLPLVRKYPALTFYLGIFLLQESIFFQKIIGILLVILMIIFLLLINSISQATT
ncbi:hypothetical protein CEN47_14970 [Fischerella thermalis CCMEE 5319]|nr:hypothetical protein CEN47_14970 [Fischerella thermalis CCMEE 5319]